MNLRRFFVPAAALVVALLLAGCQITIGPTPNPPADADYEFTANADFTSFVGTVSVPRGSSRTVDIFVPSSLRGGDRRLVVEVDDDDNDTYALDMVMFGSDRTTAYASTSGGAYFAPGLTGLGRGFLQVPVLSTGVGASSVRTSPVCQGPCIARVANDAVVRVRVDNVTGSGTLDLQVYAYVDAFLDVGEPGNDMIAGAEVVDAANGAAGMIELLGDRDYVSFPTAGLISFRENSDGVPPYTYDANLRLRIVNGLLEQQAVLVPGEDYLVQAGWYGIVFSDPSDTRATVGGAHYVFYAD